MRNFARIVHIAPLGPRFRGATAFMCGSTRAAERGRLLGVDLGEVRIGLALSDALGIAAHPLPTLVCADVHGDVEKLKQLIAEHEVRQVVIGLPLLMSGAEGQGAAAARRFANRLRKRIGAANYDVRVQLWDERLTTAQAERALISGNVKRRRRRQVVDGLAAVLILQSFLDSRSAGSEAGP